MPNWYLLRTKHRAEYRTESSLGGIGIETYLPVMPIDRRLGRYTRLSIEPAYPRYLFFAATPEVNDFHEISTVDGSAGIVKLSKENGYYVPSIIKEKDITDLKALHDDQNVINVWKTDYVENDRIRFKNGAFKDYSGIFKSIKGKTGDERVMILLESLTGNRLVETRLKDIEPAA